MSKKVTMDLRKRDWCFTHWPKPDRIINEIWDIEKCRYIVLGTEYGENDGALHYQGYIEFYDTVSLKTAQRRISNYSIHMEIRLGNNEEAADYCKKGTQTHAEFREFGSAGRNFGANAKFVEFGEKKQQGKRNDIHKCKEIIENGGTMDDVIDIATSYQSIRVGECLMKYIEPKREIKPITFLWLYGKTGSGKTKWAFENYPDLYTPTSFKWWEGYDGHKTVLLDDFRADWCSEDALLRLGDIYPMTIECKGGSRQIQFDTLIITCPLPPAEIYENGQVGALLRRITEIKFFCAEVNAQKSGGNTDPLPLTKHLENEDDYDYYDNLTEEYMNQE